MFIIDTWKKINFLLKIIFFLIFSSYDKTFIKINWLRLNYFLNLFSINYKVIKVIYKKSLFSINSSHFSNIKSKEQFDRIRIKIIFLINSIFLKELLNYSLISLINLRNVNFFLKLNSLIKIIK